MFSHARLRTRKILKHDLLFAARDVQLYSTRKMRSTLNISKKLTILDVQVPDVHAI